MNYDAIHAYSNQVQEGKGINGVSVDTGAFMPEALARYSSYKRNFAQ